MKINRQVLRILPYAFTAIIGMSLYQIARCVTDLDLKALLINLSSSFIVIPLLLFSYEQVRSWSNKKLRNALFDYIKMQVDSSLLSILSQIKKSISPYAQAGMNQKSVNELLSLSFDSLQKALSNSQLLGFQVKKRWDYNLSPIEKVIGNPYLLKFTDDDLLTTLIEIIKILRSLKKLQHADNAHTQVRGSDKSSPYSVKSGVDINSQNSAFPERLLLLEEVGKDKYTVVDFGDFATNYKQSELLSYYKYESRFTKLYSAAVIELLFYIRQWFDLTGGTILIDETVFKLGNDFSFSSGLVK